MGTLADGLRCFGLVHGAYPPRTHCRDSSRGIRSLIGKGRREAPQTHSVALPPCHITRRCPKRHFGENQLSTGLISLLLLTTAHRMSFQPQAVRTSTDSYIRFILAMDRSPVFGSTTCDLNALFTLAFASASSLKTLNLAANGNSQAHYAKGTRSHVARRP